MKIFKVLSVLMIVALSAGFASCSDDDDDKKFDAANLVGTWEATYTEGWEKEVNEPKESWSGSWKDEQESSDMATKMKFNADETGMDISLYEEENDDFTWKLVGDNLSMTYPFYTMTLVSKLLDLTETTVIIEFSYNEDGVSHYEKTTYKRVK